MITFFFFFFYTLFSFIAGAVMMYFVIKAKAQFEINSLKIRQEKIKNKMEKLEHYEA